MKYVRERDRERKGGGGERERKRERLFIAVYYRYKCQFFMARFYFFFMFKNNGCVNKREGWRNDRKRGMKRERVRDELFRVLFPSFYTTPLCLFALHPAACPTSTFTDGLQKRTQWRVAGNTHVASVCTCGFYIHAHAWMRRCTFSSFHTRRWHCCPTLKLSGEGGEGQTMAVAADVKR